MAFQHLTSKPKAFIVSLVWFVFVSSACATSVEIPVTPTNLDTYVYVFSVLTNTASDSVTFHVTITNKQYDIFPDSSASVDMVVHKKHANGGREGSIGPVKPEIPVILKKEKRLWRADFTVSRDVLKNPDVCFVFSELAHTTVNGKTIPMPSITFYELRLQDFAKP
jgi:hypothetical protein